MSVHQTKEGADCLFVRQGMKLINIRFFRGGSDLISEGEFNHERCATADRKRSGEMTASSQAPRCKQAPIDLRKLVADM